MLKTKRAWYDFDENYSYDFPSEFLFMTNDEIRKHITDKLDIVNGLLVEQKAAEKAQEISKTKLRQKAVKKLTKAEREALGL